MKILDRYVAKNFIIGYLIAFGVLMGLCVVIDMFVNVDEWVENTEDGILAIFRNMATYYGSRIALWFRDMAGMITIIAAVFSLTRMTRSNELIAVMASGVSLKRIIAPILFLALLLTGLQIADQELLIPRLAFQLTRSHDDMPGRRSYDLWFVADSNGSLISAAGYDENAGRMEHPLFLLRTKNEQTGRWVVTGQVTADAAVYDGREQGWVLENGAYRRLGSMRQAEVDTTPARLADFVASDLTPQEIPLRIQEGFKSLLSSGQIDALIHSDGTRPTDMAELHLQKHVRITDPMINLIMLMVALPVLVCRDPKNMKSAIMTSFLITSACFTATFLSKLFATEPVLGQVHPQFWAWLPVFVFFPVAWLQIDAMKT